MAKASYHAPKKIVHWRFLLSQIQDLPWHDWQQGIYKTFLAQQQSLLRTVGTRNFDRTRHLRSRSLKSRLRNSQNPKSKIQNSWVTRQLGATGWMVMTTGAFAMLYWNGKLLLATGSGVGIMLLVYLLHDWQPRLDFSQFRRFLQGWNQPFLISAAAGTFATFVIYLAVTVWAESKSGWIACGAILQGLGTLVVLSLLIWQRLNQPRNRPLFHPQSLNHPQLLSDLTHEDALKRLIAVRQLTDFVSVLEHEPAQPRGMMKPPSRRDMAEYFGLMLDRESEPIVRNAILDGLQTLDIVHQLQQVTKLPMKSKD